VSYLDELVASGNAKGALSFGN